MDWVVGVGEMNNSKAADAKARHRDLSTRLTKVPRAKHKIWGLDERETQHKATRDWQAARGAHEPQCDPPPTTASPLADLVEFERWSAEIALGIQDLREMIVCELPFRGLTCEEHSALVDLIVALRELLMISEDERPSKKLTRNRAPKAAGQVGRGQRRA